MPRLFAQLQANLSALKPTVATWLSSAGILADISAWRDAVMGWSGFVTFFLGGILTVAMIIYWMLRVRESAVRQFPHWFAK